MPSFMFVFLLIVLELARMGVGRASSAHRIFPRTRRVPWVGSGDCSNFIFYHSESYFSIVCAGQIRVFE